MKRMLLLAIFIAAAADARFITEKDIFRFQWIADPQLSPDGSQIAFVRVTVDEKKDRYRVLVMPVLEKIGRQSQSKHSASV